MKVNNVALDKVGEFSSMFLKYLHRDASLEPFYAHPPSLESFGKAIEDRLGFPENARIVVHEVLSEQYGPLDKDKAVFDNIQALKSGKTFTVTTGHQLNIFTGPLYFIFKIASTINLARKLKETYPDYDFVPVYWMASEDHDFEEINHFSLFGKRYTWETKQKGAVGRFAPHSLNEVLEQLPETVPFFEKAYLDSPTLAEAVRTYVNHLFGKEGLVVIDADHPKLKAQFTDVIKSDLKDHAANEIIEDTNNKLDELGFKTQAFVREINFFFLNGFRERITRTDDGFEVLGRDLHFGFDEMMSLVDSNPEKFSPNVIMRPLYQETILPNLGYIGGPAEVIYWLQLKGVFDHYDTFFPVIMPRNFGMVINKGLAKKIDKIGCDHADVFKPAHKLKEDFLNRNSNNEHLLDDEKTDLNALFERIRTKAGAIDKSLEGFIGAEGVKAQKVLENVEKRLKKGQETQNETVMNQIDTIRDKLFPNGTLQERHDNFLNFYLNNPDFIKALLDSFDPFDFSFYQFWET